MALSKSRDRRYQTACRPSRELVLRRRLSRRLRALAATDSRDALFRVALERIPIRWCVGCDDDGINGKDSPGFGQERRRAGDITTAAALLQREGEGARC